MNFKDDLRVQVLQPDVLCAGHTLPAQASAKPPQARGATSPEMTWQQDQFL